MSGSLKRREFIRSVSMAGASAAIAHSIDPGAFQTAGSADELANEWFRISFNRATGTFQVIKADGGHFITGATCAINLHDAAKTGKLLISSPNYKHKVRSSAFKDSVGSGEQLIITSKDANKVADVEIQISLYDNRRAFCIETICKNPGRSNLSVHSIEPLRILKSEGGAMIVPAVSKCLTNGEMYFDAGRIHELGSKKNGITSGNLKGVKLANGPIDSSHETLHSWWNMGLFTGYDKHGISLGYLNNDLCLGNLLMSKISGDELAVIAESVYPPSLLLKPGKSVSSNHVMVHTGNDIYDALENYAGVVGRVNGARTHSIINGWCSWFYTLAKVSEDEVIAEAAYASTHLKDFGLEYIQVDEGYQRWHGDWEGNERFPHGMKWLAGKIKSYGFKAGIWIAPYVISEPTEVFQKHPEWLLKNPDGSPKRIGNWQEGSVPPADENPKRYCLDITHPGAAQWLYDLTHTLVNQWGYEMIKIDFVAWSILAADHYHDPTLSSAQVYRRGMEIMRKAAGDKCHILDCGPGAVTTGVIDSMRIEADVNYGFTAAAWDTYFLHEASSAAAVARRYYFHKRTWINDADHLCMELLNDQQSEAAATIIALSGGNMISGDRLRQLDASRIDILRKITPSFGEAAKPVDLFDGETQSVFALKIKRPFAEWTIAAFFNADLKTAVEKKFSINRLWLDPAKTYLAFDFWQQQFIGEISGNINISVQPGSVRLITLHEKTGKPQFISTNRHVMQGAFEIEDVGWDENNKTISGMSKGPLHSSHNVSIYVPGDHPWTWGGSALVRDFDNYSLKLVDTHIIRVHVVFEKSERVQWKISPDQFL